MLFNATYDSFDAIPEAYRAEFEQVNGKWQLKADAIPGVGPLFNAGLAANEARAVSQVKTRNEKIKEQEQTINQLQDKLAVLDSPGNKVLSKADADSFDAYAALGTPTEIKAKLEKLPELEGKVTKFETSDALAQVAKANGLGDVKLNPEVLTDWLGATKGITAFVKTEERQDTKGQKVNVDVPYLRIEETGADGKTTVSEKELLTFAKEKMPDWKYNALISGSAEAAPAGGKGNPAPANTGGGMKVPDLGSARQQPAADGDTKRPVDKYNEQRAARPSPFAPKVLAPTPTVR